MTEEQINKTIAEYMGGPYIGDACINYYQVQGEYFCTKDFICPRCKEIKTYYTQSLDALVPVIEKLNKDGFELSHYKGTYYCTIYTMVNHNPDDAIKVDSRGLSYSLALATACAKVIKYL